MRSSSTPGFDLRGAVDSLLDSFAPRPNESASPGASDGGDIRSAILIELSDEPMHGYQIIGAIEGRSGGTWKPSPGSVYPTLQLLLDEGLVTVAQEGERKVYSVTDAGRLAATESATAASFARGTTDAGHTSGPTASEGQNRQRSPGVHGAIALTKSGASFVQALTQVAQHATPQQSERALAIVDEARRKLYAILAEE